MNNFLKNFLKNKFTPLRNLKKALEALYFQYIQSQNKKKFGYKADNSLIFMPIHISNPKNVFMYEKTRIQGYAKIITYTGKFIMKKYSGAAPGLTVVTGNHIPTVGIPHFDLTTLRINESEKDIIIEEDVWIGTNVTLLSGVTIGRGSIIGACSVITKNVPPYAIVVGNPQRIIASKFTLEQILEHEKSLYSEEERLHKDYIAQLFHTYFKGMKTIGTEL